MAWSGVDPGEWAKETKARLDAVFRTSVQGLAAEMRKTGPNGGDVPVDTGNLVRSLLAVKGGLPPQGSPDAEYAAQDIGPVLLSVKAGDTVSLAWQAIYAHRQNYGFVGEDSLGRTYNQSGRGFLERAAAKWPQIVTKAAIDARTKAGGISSTNIASKMKG